MLTEAEKEILFEEFSRKLKQVKKVNIEKLSDDVQIPQYANEGDAGCDIRSNEDVIIKPLETKIIRTGLKMAICEGYELQIRSRSGISSKTPLRVANAPGTIDSGYRGEIGIIITNTSISGNEIYDINEKNNRHGIYNIKKGDRIAQIILSQYETIDFILTGDINLIETNRNGGFGSSGND